ncbi:MAG: multidrug RND transporter, partial [Actinobacteria bacterium]|nr:multidrug RND transporter [Actinomycetota bacterium]
MFEKLGHTLVRRKKSVFTIYLIGILLAGAIGSGVFSRLESGGYSDPNSDSYKAYEYLQDVFKVEDPSVVLVVEAPTAASDPSVFATVSKLETKIKAEAHVGKTLSFWSTGGAPSLLSKDGKAGFLFVYSDKSEWG